MAGYFPQFLLHLFFKVSLSLDSLIQLSWLATEPLGSAHLSTPQGRGCRCMPSCLTLHGFWGSELSSTCLHRKHFTLWVISVPVCKF